MIKASFPAPECIRAARAYLDISQGELGDECGLSRNSVASIEKGIHANAETLAKIQKFFWEHGVEFLPDGGFRPHRELVTILEGEEGIKTFFLDVLATAELVGGEFLVSGMDELKFYNLFEELNIREAYRGNMDKITDLVSYRVLVGENQKEILKPPVAAPYCTYKTMPEDHISSDAPFYIYGDKLAIILNGITKIIIIKDRELVEAYRRTFDSLWNSRFAERVYTK